ncbi:hypothetical protein OHU17_03745 [Streptomyces goshikiensis]|uniref:Uncharacterized protein n=1 Tax=Streptomyces goshikiensis TaxID=1942 RepID=A0ABZ1RDX8_9ACTN|nr:MULTISPECIES: hypothetical protein [Streptomyces]AYV31599.1 hypothetical protein EES41_33180 [Streptomyces sp. ADI95-16]OKI60995.1 hypothetical protein AMK15_21625 [Streptomyces sp. MJM1172]PJN19812.1 hypothetical protein CG724_06180 [Streptomyces sp. CB02120-2]GHD65130.1 hypothetical protein GCM10010336_24580 [Streptomyces goshikiensis]
MYEMRAESIADRCQLLWHVIAKDTTFSTLCGSLLNPDQTPPPAADPAAERYCAPCMTAFSRAVHAFGTPSE